MMFTVQLVVTCNHKVHYMLLYMYVHKCMYV